MILRELFDNDQSEDQGDVEDNIDDRYDPDSDINVLKSTDLRKSRLTLAKISKLRKQNDAHRIEKKTDLEKIRKIYAPAPASV